MPPRTKISKEDIINTALTIARREGAKAINARAIAKELDCSTQPVFSNFAGMEELGKAVIAAANELYQKYTRQEIDAGRYPAYKATGMAYIRFAREEKELFKLLFMRDRSKETVPSETDELKTIYGIAQDSTGLETDRIKLFHLEMWSFVHGIAAMVATGYLQLDEQLISEMMTDAYQGMKKRYQEEE